MKKHVTEYALILHTLFFCIRPVEPDRLTGFLFYKQGKVGGNNPLGINQYENDELKEVDVYNIHANQTRPAGTTKQYGLRRLRKHREDFTFSLPCIKNRLHEKI